jgi:predicted nucleotidyltransferase
VANASTGFLGAKGSGAGEFKLRYHGAMQRDQVIATLRAHEAELRARGVRHAALFGSVARGEASPASDLDILIELHPEAPVGVWEYVGITQFLGDLFPVRVDVANRARLKAHVRPAAERDAVYAF